jgi:uncharacterized protein (TIGR02996 family)
VLPPHRSLTAGADGVERGLREDIYAAPDDDAPRLVYADWLIDRGDPLGSFISLQCERASRGDPNPSDAEQRLLDANWQAWIGYPAIVAVPPGIEFERGLWSACDLFDPGEHARCSPAELAMAPAWSTVRRLVVPAWLEPAASDLLRGPLGRSIRTLDVCTRDFVARLARWDGPPLAIRRLVLRDLQGEGRLPRPELPPVRVGLPALEELTVRSFGAYATKWIVAAEAAGLRALVLRFGDHELPYFKKALRRAKHTSLERLTIEMDQRFAVHAVRDRAGELAIRSIVPSPLRGPLIESLAGARRWLDDLAVHAAPDAVVSVPALGADLVATAAELGLRLAVAAPECGLRPRLG